MRILDQSAPARVKPSSNQSFNEDYNFAKRPLLSCAESLVRWRKGTQLDTISQERRTANMAAIRSRNTAPEVVVRKFLFRKGLRFRLHPKGLPGRPDVVFPSRRIAVFVHGCFWHGCTKCVDGTRMVKSNRKYWTEKIYGNQERDSRNETALRANGWVPLVIWECEVRAQRKLQRLVDSIRKIPASKMR